MDSIELPAHVLAEIALYMHQEYRKAMQPPVVAILSFEEWLQRIIEKSQNEMLVQKLKDSGAW